MTEETSPGVYCVIFSSECTVRAGCANTPYFPLTAEPEAAIQACMLWTSMDAYEGKSFSYQRDILRNC